MKGSWVLAFSVEVARFLRLGLAIVLKAGLLKGRTIELGLQHGVSSFVDFECISLAYASSHLVK